MKISLPELESRLQRIVEGTVIKFLPNSLRKKSLLVKISEAMHAGVVVGPDGALIAPNLYIIELNPADVPAEEDSRLLLENLSLYLTESAQDAGYKFPAKPVARFTPDPGLKRGETEVSALNSLETITPTSGIDPNPGNSQNSIPENAFLIVDGTDTYLLTKPVINIGRRSDNHLIISNPSVSRIHAQLRAQNGRYIVFDLDSARGTKVNGRLIRQQELSSGDVITLGEVPMVYGENE